MCSILCTSTCCITIQGHQQWINRLVEEEEVARKSKAEGMYSLYTCGYLIHFFMPLYVELDPEKVAKTKQ